MNRWGLGAIALACFVCGGVLGWLAARTPSALEGSVHAAEPPAAAEPPRSPAPPADGKLRIICFGAHPDDCELKVGGTAALWAAQGHHVKLVSVTNGDIGH